MPLLSHFGQRAERAVSRLSEISGVRVGFVHAGIQIVNQGRYRSGREPRRLQACPRRNATSRRSRSRTPLRRAGDRRTPFLVIGRGPRAAGAPPSWTSVKVLARPCCAAPHRCGARSDRSRSRGRCRSSAGRAHEGLFHRLPGLRLPDRAEEVAERGAPEAEPGDLNSQEVPRSRRNRCRSAPYPRPLSFSTDGAPCRGNGGGATTPSSRPLLPSPGTALPPPAPARSRAGAGARCGSPLAIRSVGGRAEAYPAHRFAHVARRQAFEHLRGLEPDAAHSPRDRERGTPPAAPSYPCARAGATAPALPSTP